MRSLDRLLCCLNLSPVILLLLDVFALPYSVVIFKYWCSILSIYKIFHLSSMPSLIFTFTTYHFCFILFHTKSSHITIPWFLSVLKMNYYQNSIFSIAYLLYSWNSFTFEKKKKKKKKKRRRNRRLACLPLIFVLFVALRRHFILFWFLPSLESFIWLFYFKKKT